MAPALEKAVSVYDFLYVDSRRIALFNSQFSEFGHLTSLTRSASESHSTAGSVGASIKVVSAKRDTLEAGQTAQTRQFDTQWVAPLTFLDNAKDILVRGAKNARIGQLVLVSGKLELRDLNIIKQAMLLPSMKNMMRSQPSASLSRKERRSGQSKSADPAQSANEFGQEFLATLPHALHASIHEIDGNSLWCSLRDDCLLVASTDLFLKHGVSISGTWNVVGVLDAIPEETESATVTKAEEEIASAQASMPQTDIHNAIIMATQGFGGFIDAMAPFVRMILGRPSRSYGVTPLLLFREVG